MLKKIINISFFSILIIFFIGAIVAFYMNIMPLSLNIHSKFYKASNVILDGYDMVNYLVKKKANKGNSRFGYKLDDNYWYFMNATNKKQFERRPNKYIPQFGGYCVYSISKGYTFPPDPKVWHIAKGKIYFFRNEETKKIALYNWQSVLSNAKMNWK